MIVIEQINQDIHNLPQEAQLLLIDFIELLKKRYNQTGTNTVQSSFQNKRRAFREWAESHQNRKYPYLSDKDISRESIYGDK